MASADREPISDPEAVGLFAPLRGRAGVVLAVSGGADSTALLHLFARARALDAALPEAIVATVDHRLRPEAAAEIAAVARLAATRDLPHRVLVWDGDHAGGNLQARARAARHGLLAAAARETGCDTIALAHHADDQAETFLLRLARGSGVAGLAAMAPWRRDGDLVLARPFLAITRARLEATLAAAGIGWCDDRFNTDPHYARARLRAARADLARLGLDRDRLVATARAMARAAVVIERAVDGLAADALTLPPGEGWAAIAAAPWCGADDEVRLRLSSRAIARIGGAAYGPRLAALERLDAGLVAAQAAGRPFVHTLGGVRIELRRGFVWLAAEEGRAGAVVPLAPGGCAVYGGAGFALAHAAPGPVVLAPLGTAGRRAVLAAGGRAPAVATTFAPAGIVSATPAAWCDGAVVAAPACRWVRDDWSQVLHMGPQGGAIGGRRLDDSASQ